MPSLIKKRGKERYRGSVPDPMVPGKRHQKLFPDNSRESERAAIVWEGEKARELQQLLEDQLATGTDTDCLTILEWAEAVLDDALKRYVKKTYDEKQRAFKLLMQHENVDPGMPVESLDVTIAYSHLKDQFKTRTGNAVNNDRKNLAADWDWGKDFLKGFPEEGFNPFRAAKRFPEKRHPRYVPPEIDFWKVNDATEGQDRVMFKTYHHTAARKSEVFRLKITDLDFNSDQIRLWTRKRTDGSFECDWVPMTDELRAVLIVWLDERRKMPFVDEEHLFLCLDQTPFCDQYYGKPFKVRQHFMKRLCDKVGVKQFGYHAIRHYTATMLYNDGYDLSFIQRILRHKSPATTIKYLRSLGFSLEERKLLNRAFKRPL
jgi:integrase